MGAIFLELKDLERTVEDALPEGIELVDLQLVPHSTKIVKVFIDKEGGIDVETCASVGSTLRGLFERGGFFGGKYVLEVSSPGLERALRKPSDFKRFIGRKIKVRMFSEIGGRKRFKGKLVDADDESFAISLESGENLELLYPDLSKANLIWKIGGDKDEL